MWKSILSIAPNKEGGLHYYFLTVEEKERIRLLTGNIYKLNLYENMIVKGKECSRIKIVTLLRNNCAFRLQTAINEHILFIKYKVVM